MHACPLGYLKVIYANVLFLIFHHNYVGAILPSREQMRNIAKYDRSKLLPFKNTYDNLDTLGRFVRLSTHKPSARWVFATDFSLELLADAKQFLIDTKHGTIIKHLISLKHERVDMHTHTRTRTQTQTQTHMHTHTHMYLLYFYSADIFIISAEDVVINKGHLTSVLIEVGSFWIAPVRMIHYNLDAAEYEEFLRLVSVLHLLLCTLCV